MMITIKNSNSTIINLALTAAFIAACINVYLQVKYLTVGRGLYFGYDTTVEWKILVIVFWLLWLLGSVGLFFEKKFAFILLFPVSVLSIVAVLFSLGQVIYKSIDVQLYYYFGLLVAIVILVYINITRVRERLALPRNYYLFGSLVLIVMAALFLVVEKRWHP